MPRTFVRSFILCRFFVRFPGLVWCGVTQECVFVYTRRSFVFSRRPLHITFGFKEASRGVRAGMHEIRDGTTKESPFRIVEDVDARSRAPSSLSR